MLHENDDVCGHAYSVTLLTMQLLSQVLVNENLNVWRISALEVLKPMLCCG